jgi:hypothetical protein
MFETAAPSSTGIDTPPDGCWQSRPAGDIVFATVPPYRAMGWVSMGVPLLTGYLDQAGISSRIVRFDHGPRSAPQEFVDLQSLTLFTNPSVSERLARIRAADGRHPAFFDLLLSRLLAGPESVFGFSTWRMNVDVALEVARRVKDRRPDAYIVFGGPEASTATPDLQQDWIDVVVWGSAERVIVPVVRALLDRQPAEAGVSDNVWVHPRHGSPRRTVALDTGPVSLPRIDYTRIVPLQVGAPTPAVPILLNLGFPFRCRFCTNTNGYPQMAWGSADRLVEEMQEIMRVWKSLHPNGDAPNMQLTLSDAAANAQPAQFDALCKGIIAADWALPPQGINGQLIIDSRMTPQRIKLLTDAGMTSWSFGLESANPRIRTEMKKPGSKESIVKALKECSNQGWPGIAMSVIVGWPGETEAEFLETVEFLEWAVSIGMLRMLIPLPMFSGPAMMDADLLGGGTDIDMAWNLPIEAGSPLVRARRYFSLFEHFEGLANVRSPIPHRLVAATMLGDGYADHVERWIATYGEHPLEEEPCEGQPEERLKEPSALPIGRPERSAEQRVGTA